MDQSLDIAAQQHATIEDHILSTNPSQTENPVQSFSNSLSLAESESLQSSQENSFSNKLARLRDFSNDLLIYIFSLCDARNVGRLRQCCKYFRDLSIAKVVWLEILKRSCSDLNLPAPAFPERAFSSREIELLATSWIRFQTVLRNPRDGKPPPHTMVRKVVIQGC
ncbi:hypothetical protein DL96DRAFT_118896 [Flagelloscypha sp. PMI_526]|nr:hypothetical protein DL96DRAFT_118896 [Flagelloscypha sp. PMI_526]